AAVTCGAPDLSKLIIVEHSLASLCTLRLDCSDSRILFSEAHAHSPGIECGQRPASATGADAAVLSYDLAQPQGDITTCDLIDGRGVQRLEKMARESCALPSAWPPGNHPRQPGGCARVFAAFAAPRSSRLAGPHRALPWPGPSLLRLSPALPSLFPP